MFGFFKQQKKSASSTKEEDYNFDPLRAAKEMAASHGLKMFDSFLDVMKKQAVDGKHFKAIDFHNNTLRDSEEPYKALLRSLACEVADELNRLG